MENKEYPRTEIAGSLSLEEMVRRIVREEIAAHMERLDGKTIGAAAVAEINQAFRSGRRPYFPI